VKLKNDEDFSYREITQKIADYISTTFSEKKIKKL
jgi:hypothetical protein